MSPLTLVESLPGAYALDRVYKDVYKCARCPRSETREQVVFGYGNTEDPPVVFVGLAPSRADDDAGYPFSGPDEMPLLERMLGRLGLGRKDAYFMHAVACFGEALEAESACTPVRESQLLATGPRSIVVLGERAGRLLGQEKLHTWGTWRDVPICVTYEVGYLVGHPEARHVAWAALQQLPQRRLK